MTYAGLNRPISTVSDLVPRKNIRRRLLCRRRRRVQPDPEGVQAGNYGALHAWTKTG